MDFHPEGCECKRRTRTSDVSHHAQTHPDHFLGSKLSTLPAGEPVDASHSGAQCETAHA